MKKQQLLKTAHDIFYQQGFHACGVELLARQAGTTKRTLYAHFNSKEGLIAAVLDYRHQWFMTRLTDYLDDTPPEQVIRRYLAFLQDWIQSGDFYGCLFINACSEFSDHASAPHKIAQAHKQTVRDYLQQCLGNAEMAELLFIYGEGLIVSSQAAGQLATTHVEAFIQQWQASA